MADLHVPLEPLSIWEILDRSVRLYRRHLWRFFGVSVLVSLAAYAILGPFAYGLQVYLEHRESMGWRAASLPGLLSLALGGILLMWTLTLVRSGVLAVLVGEAYVKGEARLETLLTKLPLGRLAAASLLCSLIVVAGSLVLLVPGVYLAINYVLVPVVAALEGRGARGALGRSRWLVRARMARGFFNNNITRIMVIWVFFTALAMLASAIQFTLMGIAWRLWGESGHVGNAMVRFSYPMLPRGIMVAVDLLAQVTAAFFQPFALCAMVLLYYDIRVKKEGLDIEMMLDQLDAGVADGRESQRG